MNKTRWMLSLLAALVLPFSSASAQVTAQPAQEASTSLRVFLDCEWECDENFLRTEIDFIDWVRDRKDAEVHIMVATQRTGSGGQQYTFDFIGLRSFAGTADTLGYATSPDDTDDKSRREMARLLKLGLVPYLTQTAIADRLQLVFDKPTQAPTDAASASETPQRDPWNFWVFRLSGNGFANGEERQDSRTFYGSLSANRTTEEWKISLSLSGNENRNRFGTGEDEKVFKRHSYSASALVAKSMTGHFSTGLQASARRASFSNHEMLMTVQPVVEYNVFPYAESTRRLFTLRYGVGMTRADYEDETIWGKMGETLGSHTLEASYEVKQPWGSLNVSAEGLQYLQQRDKYRLELGGYTSIRLFKGLSFNVGGNVSRIRDQLALRKGDIPPEEVLLRQRELDTGYRYFTNFGLSYSFGSIYNNVVNPRLGNSGGGMIIRM